MGASNPVEGAKRAVALAREMGLKIKVAAVTGDDVFDKIDPGTVAIETNEPLKNSGELISANAYLGMEGILQAIETGANIIITGRVADPSLFLAPMVAEFGWRVDDYDLMGKGTVIGHLLECAGQITGGYFADPIMKPVDDLAHLGHPLAEINADGSAIITKVSGTGGVVDLRTVKEQLLYEVINPFEYFTPDVIADFTTVKLKEVNRDEVHISGGTGKTKPSTLKVSVGYKAFWLGEGEISYAGEAAVERARLAGDIIAERLAENNIAEVRIDCVGLNSVHRTNFGVASESEPYEVRLRVAGKARSMEKAALVGEEVEALYTNGPAGGGGVRKYVNEVIGIVSTFMERKNAEAQVFIFES